MSEAKLNEASSNEAPSKPRPNSIFALCVVVPLMFLVTLLPIHWDGLTTRPTFFVEALGAVGLYFALLFLSIGLDFIIYRRWRTKQLQSNGGRNE